MVWQPDETRDEDVQIAATLCPNPSEKTGPADEFRGQVELLGGNKKSIVGNQKNKQRFVGGKD